MPMGSPPPSLVLTLWRGNRKRWTRRSTTNRRRSASYQPAPSLHLLKPTSPPLLAPWFPSFATPHLVSLTSRHHRPRSRASSPASSMRRPLAARRPMPRRRPPPAPASRTRRNGHWSGSGFGGEEAQGDTACGGAGAPRCNHSDDGQIHCSCRRWARLVLIFFVWGILRSIIFYAPWSEPFLLPIPSRSLNKLTEPHPLGLLSHPMKMLCSTWPLCEEHRIIDAFVSPLAGYRVPYSEKKGLNDVVNN